jgi:hypothetical protein
MTQSYARTTIEGAEYVLVPAEDWDFEGDESSPAWWDYILNDETAIADIGWYANVLIPLGITMRTDMLPEDNAQMPGLLSRIVRSSLMTIWLNEGEDPRWTPQVDIDDNWEPRLEVVFSSLQSSLIAQTDEDFNQHVKSVAYEAACWLQAALTQSEFEVDADDDVPEVNTTVSNTTSRENNS